MCLDRVYLTTEFIDGEFIGVGYKAVSAKNGLLYGSDFLKMVDVNNPQWLISEANDIAKNVGYPIGFHLFINKEDAMKYRMNHSPQVAKFYFRNIIAFGLNESGFSHCKFYLATCVVAHEMKLAEVYDDILDK